MFLSLKTRAKKAIVFILILAGISIIVITITNLAGDSIFSDKSKKIIIDSDGAHSVSDIFALSRLLIEPEIEVKGVTSVHSEFDNHLTDSSLYSNFAVNKKVLQLFSLSYIPHFKGAKTRIRNFGKPVPPSTEAAEFIIETVKELKRKEKIDIICLGSLSNIATAILIAPDIIPRINIYFGSMLYDTRFKIWNKNEFNARNDLDALDIVLNTRELSINIMPASLSERFVFSKSEANKYFEEEGQVWEYLLSQWDDQEQVGVEISMNEVALVEAYLKKEYASRKESLTPPENNQRTISVYTSINETLMRADFYSSVIEYNRKQD